MKDKKIEPNRNSRSRQYILITPIKNEEVNLPKLIHSIVNQTLKPVLWVIVDDGSVDSSPTIIKDAIKEYGNWIRYIRLESNGRDLGLHLAQVIKKGFDFAVEYCKKNQISYNYLGNVDGDLMLEHTFFENIVKEFEKDPKLGIASGGTVFIIKNREIPGEGLPPDEPSGGHMVIRKKCFEECGGIPISYAWDSVLKAKARLRGWKTRRFEENIAIEMRGAGSAEGYWKEFIQK